MNIFKKLFSRSCVYTVILSVIVAISALFGDFGAAIIPLTQYLIILLVGTILATSQEIFSAKRLRFAYRLLIHYASVTASLTALFALTGKITTAGATGIFVWAAIFTLLYALAFLAFLLFCRLRGVHYAGTREGALARAKENAAYTPRYK